MDLCQCILSDMFSLLYSILHSIAINQLVVWAAQQEVIVQQVTVELPRQMAALQRCNCQCPMYCYGVREECQLRTEELHQMYILLENISINQSKSLID